MPQREHISVVIVGGGISGIAQGIRLKEALGKRVTLTILERAGSPGGIWRDSTWPGSGVDVPIHLYSLYSDLKPDWKRVFATQEEVLEYWESLIDRYELRGSFRFYTEYVSSTWSEKTQSHTVEVRNVQTKDHQELRADVLIAANGPLSSPKFPNIPGIDTFQGVSFHNLRWNASVDFTGKRVAVLGSGSSAIQFIPGLAEIPGVQLTQFIRSGGYFYPKINTEYTALQKFAFKYVPGWMRWNRYQLFLDHEYKWKARNYVEGVGHDDLESKLLAYLRETAPAEYLHALEPKYPLGCKRPAFDAGWLKSLHRENVHLTNTPIQSIVPTGLTTVDGIKHDLDIIIYATGCDVARDGVGLNAGVHGEGGLELKEYWRSIDGPQSYSGLAVPGFPNYFMVLGPNAISGSWGFTIGVQTEVIARIVKEMVAYGIGALQPKEEVFLTQNALIQETLRTSTMASGLCTNWWRIPDGRISVPSMLSAVELWKATRKTLWSDWKTVKSNGGWKGESRDQLIDVESIRRVQSLKRLAAVAGIGGLAFWWTGGRNALELLLARP